MFSAGKTNSCPDPVKRIAQARIFYSAFSGSRQPLPSKLPEGGISRTAPAAHSPDTAGQPQKPLQREPLPLRYEQGVPRGSPPLGRLFMMLHLFKALFETVSLRIRYNENNRTEEERPAFILFLKSAFSFVLFPPFAFLFSERIAYTILHPSRQQRRGTGIHFLAALCKRRPAGLFAVRPSRLHTLLSFPDTGRRPPGVFRLKNTRFFSV